MCHKTLNLVDAINSLLKVYFPLLAFHTIIFSSMKFRSSLYMEALWELACSISPDFFSIHVKFQCVCVCVCVTVIVGSFEALIVLLGNLNINYL